MTGPGDDDLGGKLIEPEEYQANERLALADEDERLPWLDSDDEVAEPEVDTGRVIAFVLVALISLAAIIGALWYFFGNVQKVDAVADGSTIEAPDAPYKTRPEDAGGRVVEGTGDTSFAVGEGQELEGRVAETAAPRPSIDREQAGSVKTVVTGVGVQVGAYSSRASAEAGWSELNRRYGEILGGANHRIVEGVVDGATVYRLQAIAGDSDSADSLCSRLKASGADCQVKR